MRQLTSLKPSSSESIVLSKKLNIIKYPWHVSHDYELCKLPQNMILLSNTHRRWNVNNRPIPDHVEFVNSIDDRETDLMILHVDQWTWHELDKRLLFLDYRDRYKKPKIIINHGCNMVDGCSSEQMKELIGDNFMVCNSSTAHKLWGIEKSRFIRHGMTPEEWPQTNYGRANIVVNQAFSKIHQDYRNNAAVLEFEEKTGIKIDWIGRDCKFNSFDKYRAFLATSSILFSPSYASPNPRARTEAMLCGMVLVTTNCHGESEYIRNGENGYASNNMNELYEYLEFLYRNPDEVRRVGKSARKMAQKVFHIDQFIDQWQEVLSQVLT
jgi:glycosyltransferase involved in cell wall biosynthesis